MTRAYVQVELVLGKVGIGIRDRWGGRKVWAFLSVVLFL